MTTSITRGEWNNTAKSFEHNIEHWGKCDCLFREQGYTRRQKQVQKQGEKCPPSFGSSNNMCTRERKTGCKKCGWRTLEAKHCQASVVLLRCTKLGEVHWRSWSWLKKKKEWQKTEDNGDGFAALCATVVSNCKLFRLDSDSVLLLLLLPKSQSVWSWTAGHIHSLVHSFIRCVAFSNSVS